MFIFATLTRGIIKYGKITVSATAQEQDESLGGYLSSQSFAGKVTGVYLFKKTLTGDQCKQITARHCSTEEVTKYFGIATFKTK